MKNLSRILFVITILAIFYFSSQPGLVSKAQTENFRHFFGISYKVLGINFRKWAHVFIYFLLGFLFILSLGKLTLKKFILSFFFILIFGFFDELYQSQIPRRISTLKDVKIDFYGGSAGIFLASFLKIVFQSIQKRLSKK
ncbi:MAG: VanZ family protein [Fusobacteriaceae bacterium]